MKTNEVWINTRDRSLWCRMVLSDEVAERRYRFATQGRTLSQFQTVITCCPLDADLEGVYQIVTLITSGDKAVSVINNDNFVKSPNTIVNEMWKKWDND